MQSREGYSTARHQKDRKNLRLTRARVVSAILIIATVIAIAVLVNMLLLGTATITRPTAPPSVAAIRDEWGYNILLPTAMPNCLVYDESGTSIRSEPASNTGQALQITLVPQASAACADASGSIVRIVEAPLLSSLGGDVSTVSHGNMQFARVTRPATPGEAEITLQWHCKSIMCRMTGTTSTAVTEDLLTKMADSFEIIK